MTRIKMPNDKKAEIQQNIRYGEHEKAVDFENIHSTEPVSY